MAGLKRRLQSSWHRHQRRRGVHAESPRRLTVEKTSWLNDANSPVMLGIDDLANAWHTNDGAGRWVDGGDWGGGFWRKGSALHFLLERLLREFPEVRTTFFTLAGPLSPYTHQQPFTHSAALDATEESRQFFRSVAEDPRFELAYHGFNHGTPGAHTEDFVQEWRAFASVDAAVAQTRRGLDIFYRATGKVPRGGKYGGWDYNEFAEPALEQCGFTWWCRDWMPRDVTGRISDDYYEPHVFGSSLVVALPTTLHGRFWDRRQVDILLERKQLIAIEEHIAPVRPDGRIQTPNIVDDLDDLRRLFSYLRGKNVWHATASEIADYVTARDRSLIYDVGIDGFSLRYEGRVAKPLLTLRIDCLAVCSPAEQLIEVILPDDNAAGRGGFRFDRDRYRHVVTVPVIEGRYRIRSCCG